MTEYHSQEAIALISRTARQKSPAKENDASINSLRIHKTLYARTFNFKMFGKSLITWITISMEYCASFYSIIITYKFTLLQFQFLYFFYFHAILSWRNYYFSSQTHFKVFKRHKYLSFMVQILKIFKKTLFKKGEIFVPCDNSLRHVKHAAKVFFLFYESYPYGYSYSYSYSISITILSGTCSAKHNIVITLTLN